jgi:DNA repair exonuclease SbcCD ATPase subunit
MSQVIFQKISFKNLLSYGNYETVFDYTDAKNTLIASKNGAGKSALALDSICYALFNKPYRNIKLGQLINSINNKNLLVTIWFGVGSDLFKVVRGQKPSVFEIWKNDELIPEDSNSRAYQSLLEGILGFNYTTFKQIVVIGAANYVPFMQLEAKDRRAVIEDILDISIFSDMSALATKQVSEIKSAISNINYEIDLTSDQVESTKKTLLLMENNRDAAESERIQKLSAAHEQLNGYLEEETRLTDIIANLTQKPIETAPIQTGISRVVSQLSVAKHKKSASKETIDFFQGHDECPQCKQAIGNDVKNQVLTEEQEKTAAADKSIIQLKEIHEQLIQKLQVMEAVADKIDNTNSDIRLVRNNIRHVNKTISDLSQPIKESDTSGLKETKDRMDELNQILEQKKTTKSELVETGAYVSMAVAMLKDTGIKSKIIAQYIPLMNQLINDYLSKFDMFVDFSLDENFNETIRSRNRDAFTYNSFSEGEKMRLDMAILFAWRKIAMSKNSLATNLIIFDETMDSSLDEESVNVFASILESLEDGMRVMVVSHRNVVPELFDRVVNIKKVNDFSVLQ